MTKLNKALAYFQLIGFSIMLVFFSIYKISEGIEEAIYTIPISIILLFPFILIAIIALKKKKKEKENLNFYLNAFFVFIAFTGLVLLLLLSYSFNYALLVLIVMSIFCIFLRSADVKLMLIYLLGCTFLLAICALVFGRYLQFTLY